jgi:hypothetical protein
MDLLLKARIARSEDENTALVNARCREGLDPATAAPDRDELNDKSGGMPNENR